MLKNTWFVLAFIFVSTSAFASLDPIPGTCRKPGFDGWSHCQFVSSVDGSKHSGSIHSSALSCFHYIGWESDPACAGPSEATCRLRNTYYVGDCLERVEIPFGLDDFDAKVVAEERCEEIRDCLNNPRCVTRACTSTTIRGGWRLLEVTIR